MTLTIYNICLLMKLFLVVGVFFYVSKHHYTSQVELFLYIYLFVMVISLFNLSFNIFISQMLVEVYIKNFAMSICWPCIPSCLTL